MQAIEFETIVKNGIITLPIDQKQWNEKKIRVILLDESETTEIEYEKEEQVEFFAAAGLWRDLDIEQVDIRKQAWRDRTK